MNLVDLAAPSILHLLDTFQNSPVEMLSFDKLFSLYIKSTTFIMVAKEEKHVRDSDFYGLVNGHVAKNMSTKDYWLIFWSNDGKTAWRYDRIKQLNYFTIFDTIFPQKLKAVN